MRIIFAGGGTAGHINPALAVAKFLKQKEPTIQILYIGSKGGMEEKLVPQAGLDFKSIDVSGFSRNISIQGFKRNIKAIGNLLNATQQSKKIIKDFNPDICMGTGGYVSGPVLRQAAKMGVPIILHEQNAFPGVTTKLLAKKAEVLMLASKEAEKYLDSKSNCLVTGNPIRSQIFNVNKEEARKKLGLDSRPLILSFGGSLGARKVNEAVLELILNTAKDDKYQHIHAFGRFGDWFIPELEKKGLQLKNHSNLDVRAYINDMHICLAAADLVICRAGAITLSEIEAAGKAAILIPSPNVAENHQFHNAMALVKNNAAEILEEKDLTAGNLINKVQNILENPQDKINLEKNAKKMAILDANERIYSQIKKYAKNR